MEPVKVILRTRKFGDSKEVQYVSFFSNTFTESPIFQTQHLIISEIYKSLTKACLCPACYNNVS